MFLSGCRRSWSICFRYFSISKRSFDATSYLAIFGLSMLEDEKDRVLVDDPGVGSPTRRHCFHRNISFSPKNTQADRTRPTPTIPKSPRKSPSCIGRDVYPPCNCNYIYVWHCRIAKNKIYLVMNRDFYPWSLGGENILIIQLDLLTSIWIAKIV